MKFETVYDDLCAKRLTLLEAAQLLGVSERTSDDILKGKKLTD